MGQDPGEVRHEVEEVEQAREQMGDTVEALAYKANAPRRAKDTIVDKITAAKERINADPRTDKIRSGAQAAKDAVDGMRTGSASSPRAGDGSTVRDRSQPVIAQLRQVPPKTAAGLAASLLAGYVLGRRRGRRRRRYS